MKQVKNFCDHCKKLIKKDIYHFTLQTERFLFSEDMVDLCEDCMSKFEKMVELFFEPEDGSEKK